MLFRNKMTSKPAIFQKYPKPRIRWLSYGLLSVLDGLINHDISHKFIKYSHPQILPQPWAKPKSKNSPKQIQCFYKFRTISSPISVIQVSFSRTKTNQNTPHHQPLQRNHLPMGALSHAHLQQSLNRINTLPHSAWDLWHCMGCERPHLPRPQVECQSIYRLQLILHTVSHPLLAYSCPPSSWFRYLWALKPANHLFSFALSPRISLNDGLRLSKVQSLEGKTR